MSRVVAVAGPLEEVAGQTFEALPRDLDVERRAVREQPEVLRRN